MGRFSDIFSSVTELAKDKLQLQNGIKNQEVQQSAPEIDIASLFEPELSMEELLGKNLPDARKWADSMAIRAEERARTKVEEAAKRAAEEQARAEAEEAAKRVAEEQAEEAAKRAAEEKAKAEANIRPNGNTPAVEVKKQVREAEIASWRTKNESEEERAISIQLDKDYRDICQAAKYGANTLDDLEAAIGRKVFIYCTETEKHQILFPNPAEEQARVDAEEKAKGEVEWKDGVITYKGKFVYETYLSIWSLEMNSDAIKRVDFSQAEDMSECPDFSRCRNLKEILLPHGLTAIPEREFSGCVSLEHIELPSVVSIGKRAFDGCESLEHIELPPSVVSIGDYAFDRCKSLKHIELPSSVESIGTGAFSNTGMESITLPAGLKTLNNIGSVKYIDASQCRNVRSISKGTFRNSSVVYLPANVDELADESIGFADTVYAPATLRRVGKQTFVKNMVCLSPILNSLSISDSKISLYVKDEYADSYVSRAKREGVLNTKVNFFTRAVNEYFYDE